MLLPNTQIQNNLWNYHPHEEDPDSADWDNVYKQLIPRDQYRGISFLHFFKFARATTIISNLL